MKLSNVTPKHLNAQILISTALFIIFSGLLQGCLSESTFDLEQQQIFESQFHQGMSRNEVEQKLELFGEHTFVEEWQFPNGELRVEYHTPTKHWGSPTYFFRFSPQDELISVYPISS